MSNLLFYTVVVGLTSGILSRSFFDIRFPDIVFLLVLSAALGLIGRIKERSVHSALFITSIFLLSVSVGSFRLDVSESKLSPLRSELGKPIVLEGIVAREPDRRNASTHLYIREKETGALVLVVADQFEKADYGDYVSVKGTLKKPEPFETDTGRTFDYTKYLRGKGVQEMISYGEVTVTEHGGGNPILKRLYAVKSALLESIEKAIPEPAAGLGEGITLGVKRALGEDLTEIFRIAGIVHIVVLSGYNIMIVADSVMRMLARFFYPRTRLIIGISSIIFFALLVGLSSTVVRASIMVSLILIARTMGRGYVALRALCLTGIVMLLINPYLLAFDPGFQLSFLATLGLILIAPEFEKRLTRVPATWGIRGYLATTLGTQLYVLPLLLFSMGTVSVVGVLVNLLVLPFIPFAMFATFGVGVVGLVSNTVALVVGYIPYIVLMYVVKVASLAASLPFAQITFPPFHYSIVFLIFAGIGYFTYRLSRNGENTAEKIESNPYEGWTIVTEKELSLDGQSPSSDKTDPLPFR